MSPVGELFSMIRIISFLIILSFPILGYTPGKWSHKDAYLFKKIKKVPSKEIVRNGEGQVVYVAEYEYNSDGKLITETYSDKEGKGDGKTSFRYTDGLLSSEEVYDNGGHLVERKDFQFKGRSLKKMNVKDGEGRLLIVYSIESDGEGNVFAAEGKNLETKDNESFRFQIDPKHPNVQIQYLTDDKKKGLGEIHFKFDAKGNLVEREFFQGETRRVHKLKYKADGSLETHSFHVKQGDNWILEKTHVLVYE